MLCLVVLTVCISVLVFGRHSLSDTVQKMLMIAAVSALLGTAVGVYEKQNPVLHEGSTLIRHKNGEGDYQEDMLLYVEELEGPYTYPVDVPEQSLTKEQKEMFLAEAINEIEEEFPGENESVNCIRNKVMIKDTYQNGQVMAEWMFDNYSVVDFEGNIIAEDLPKDGILAEAEVRLSCKDAVLSHTFSFRVFPRQLNEEEQFFKELTDYLKLQELEEGSAFMKLPEKILGYSVSWREAKEHLPEKLLFMGLVLSVAIPLEKRSREREACKKREIQLALEYPEMVSKLMLLLGAGMTVSSAWKRITASYLQKRKNNSYEIKPVYEEMLFTCHEVESGVGEERAYERFGERCGQRRYRKLGNILTQNLKKGTRGLTVMLEAEVEDAFEERKSIARKYGEEAGTKLLLPMLLMLGIVMFILIVPAVFSFQI